LTLINHGNVLNDNGSVDNFGDQGSVNDWKRVNDNWCRIRNWRLNSGPLRFRGSWSLDWSRSLNWSLSWNWSLDWHQIGEHDREHLLNPETGNLCSRRIQVNVSSWFENVCPNLSSSIQH
jgi:hypothetical protein